MPRSVGRFFEPESFTAWLAGIVVKDGRLDIAAFREAYDDQGPALAGSRRP